jgi:hypothetical protein
MASFLKWGNHRVSPGFVEFSGGINDGTSLEKERQDIKKLYSKLITVMDGFPYQEGNVLSKILW